jgi:DNA-binding PadR family transcriptional regulator
MSAKHAVLGLVIERPGYGYELALRLDERCGRWGWGRSGVYGALTQLERHGHVRSRGEKGRGSSGRAAPRVIYESTAKGRSFFEDWIFGSSEPSPFRQELDLKILLSGPEFLPRLIDQTWAQEQQCLNDLRALTSAPPLGLPAGRLAWREAAVLLQRDAAIKMLQTRIECLQDARTVMTEILARLPDKPPS